MCVVFRLTTRPRSLHQEGYGGLYRGLTSLWGRQIPYTMMKFSCFEKTVQVRSSLLLSSRLRQLLSGPCAASRAGAQSATP